MLRGLRSKLAAIFVFLSLLGLSLVIFGVSSINQVSDQAHLVMAERIPLLRATEEALLALTTGAVTIDRILLIQDNEEINKINQLETAFNGSVLVFETFIKSIMWGSESEAFIQSSTGNSFRLWKQMGLKDILMVTPAPHEIQQRAGKADLYFGGFSKYVEKVIKSQRKILDLRALGKTDEVTQEEIQRNQYIKKANRFKGLVDRTLQKVVKGIDSYVEEADEKIGQSRDTAIRTLIVYSIVIFVLVLIIGIFFVRSISAPLIHLKNAAAEIANGNLDTKVEVKSKDEFGALAFTFNKMVEEVAKAYDELEQKVSNRTSELYESNNQLRDEVIERQRVEAEVRKMAEEVQRTYDSLETQVRARTKELESFVYALSHDLKGPVVSLQGVTSMLLQEYGAKVDEKGIHYIRRIMSNADYMDKFIQGMLSLTKVGAQGKNINQIEIREVLAKMANTYYDEFKKRNIEIVVDPSLPYFVFGSLHLNHLFDCLINNAVKFMGEQPHPMIEIGGHESKEWIEFYVKDNGIGIDPAYHEKIYDAFEQLKDIEVSGVGVGLSIVKKVMNLSGGETWVNSKKGEGATFFVRFPRAGQPEKPASDEPVQQHHQSG